jgi:hypothetical protein
MSKVMTPKIGPANNAHHWADWQKRHRAPRPRDLLRKMHEERVKSSQVRAEEIDVIRKRPEPEKEFFTSAHAVAKSSESKPKKIEKL